MTNTTELENRKINLPTTCIKFVNFYTAQLQIALIKLAMLLVIILLGNQPSNGQLQMHVETNPPVQ